MNHLRLLRFIRTFNSLGIFVTFWELSFDDNPKSQIFTCSMLFNRIFLAAKSPCTIYIHKFFTSFPFVSLRRLYVDVTYTYLLVTNKLHCVTNLKCPWNKGFRTDCCTDIDALVCVTICLPRIRILSPVYKNSIRHVIYERVPLLLQKCIKWPQWAQFQKKQEVNNVNIIILVIAMLLGGEAKQVNYIFMASEFFQKLYLVILCNMKFFVFPFSIGKLHSNTFAFVASLHYYTKLAFSNNAGGIWNQ